MRQLNIWHSLTAQNASPTLIFKGIRLLLLVWLLVICASATWAGNTNPSASLSLNEACDNVINGGLVEGEEFGCPSPTWNPSPITNVELPSGGTGNLEYIWIFTTMDPTLPNALWTPIANSNSIDYDPGPISVTTHYRRCARRSGCTDYVGETNIVTKEALCCDNVITGGLIGDDQSQCSAPFDPDPLVNLTLPSGGSNALEFQWFFSTTGSPYSPASPDWTLIPGADTAIYDPGALSVTTWFVRVARRHGCTDYVGISNLVEISISNTMQISASPAPATCFGSSDGSIQVQVTGGQAPLLFAWSPDLGNVEDPQNLPAGNYSVTVTDANGCNASTATTVTEGGEILVTLAPTSPACAGDLNGFITVEAINGGAPNYTFLWNDPAGQTTSTVFDLGVGTYTLTVTDANGCTTTASATLSAGAEILLTSSVTNLLCAGDFSGAATIFATGGAEPYSYLWDDPAAQTTQTATGLAAGAYLVEVTDSNGCSVKGLVVVAEGAQLTLTLIHEDATCGGFADGSATVQTIDGGTAPYDYLWNDSAAQTTATAGSLPMGTYSVTVTDANGCTATGTETISAPMVLNISVTSASVSCFGGSNGGASVTIQNADPADFTYSWNDPSNSTTQGISNLVAGTYGVTVTDVNGCTASSSVVITQPAALVLTMQADSAACFGGSDGTASVNVTGGVAFGNGDYAYYWDAPGNPSVSALDDVSPGIYSVTVTDANGCTATNSVEIGAPLALTVSTTVEDATCVAAANGAAFALASGGVLPFQFLWNDPAWQGSAAAQGLVPGSYTVTVTDAHGCTATASATLAETPSFTISTTAQDVTCFGENNGGAFVSVFGTPLGGGASYLWDDPAGSTSQILSNLEPGTYGVTVTDGLGCSQVDSVSIAEPPLLVLTIDKTDVLCAGDSNGTATGVASGGVEPYFFEWENGWQSAFLSNLPTGDYALTVTDANGCTAFASTTLVFSSTLSVTTSANETSCADGNDGSATAFATGGGSLIYLYSWSNGATAATNENLSPGTYFVTVTGNDGCTVSDSAVVGSPPLLTCQIELVSAISTFGGSDGIAAVIAGGGVAPYSYIWTNGSLNDLAENLNAGTHSVTVSDANDCHCVTHISMKNPSKIGNFIWNDLNQNGIQDAGEPGIAGVSVQLTGTTAIGNSVNMNTISDSSGYYYFDGLEHGFYSLAYSLLPNHLFTNQNIGSDAYDSDANPVTGSTGQFLLGISYYDQNWDCGMIALDEKVNIGDYVWLDFDHDGIQDSTEAGVEGFQVRLLSMPGAAQVAITSTNFLGKYYFQDVLPGSYVVEFMPGSLLPGNVFSPKNQGADDARDSDANPATGRTDVFQVLPYTLDILTIDCGILKECDNVTDGGLIGFDENLCGIGADPAEIISIGDPSGGFGAAEYLWLQSNVPVWNGPGDPNWQPIIPSNSPNYNPGPLTQSTYYIRCSRRQGCNDYVGETNIVAKTIVPFPLTQIIDEPEELCEFVNGRFEAAIAGGGATYAWNFGGGATPASANTRVVDAVSWNTPGTKLVTLTVTRLGCSFSVQTFVHVNDCGGNLLLVIDDLQAQMASDGQVHLSWSVSGNAHGVVFFVQRSDNGITFDNLGALTAEAENQNPEFQFIDTKPRLGENQYRIKFRHLTEDWDGFSNVATAHFKPETVGLVATYPNPTSGNFTVELLEPGNEPATVEINDAFGKPVLQRAMLAKQEKLELDLRSLPTGVYLVKVKQAGYREQVRRLVKTE